MGAFYDKYLRRNVISHICYMGKLAMRENQTETTESPSPAAHVSLALAWRWNLIYL